MTTLINRLQRTIAVAAIAAVGIMAPGAGFMAPGLAGPDTASAAGKKSATVVPLVIVNGSGSSDDLYVYIQGLNASGDFVYVTDTSGTVAALPSTNGKYKPFGINIGTKKKTKISVPQLSGARIYLSLASGMQILVSSSGAPSTPIGWSTGDSNYNTIYDWVEYTWTPAPAKPVPGRPGSALNANATQVDMLGLPMLIMMKGIDANSNPIVTKAGFSKAAARTKIFSTLSAAAAPWNGLVLGTKGQTPLRVISPYNGMKLGTFPTDQLDSYIAQTYSHFTPSHGKSVVMTANTNAGGTNATFTGQVSNNNLVFTQSGSGNSGNTVTFATPTSLQAYEGFSGTLPTNPSSNLTAQAAQIETYVQAGFMRTTMLTNTTISNCPGTKAYYKNTPVNQYSKTIHRWAYKNQAYGFGYDDVCNQASDYTVFSPKKVTVKILPLGSASAYR